MKTLTNSQQAGKKTKQKWKVQSKENIPISLVEMTSLLLNLLGSFDYLS